MSGVHPRGYARLSAAQASSLHEAITRAVSCDCTTLHSTKLRLCRDDKGISSQSAACNPNDSMRLSLYFPLRLQTWSISHTILGPDDIWRAAEVEMALNEEDYSSQPVQFSDETSNLLNVVSRTTDGSGRRVSFQASGDRKSSLSSMARTVSPQIINLRHALKQHNDDSPPCLGYVCDDVGRCHTLRLSPSDIISSTQFRQVITLKKLLVKDESSATRLCRRSRLIIALIMAKSLLRLHGSPWLNSTWGKEDIYLFKDDCGEILADHPLLASNFISTQPLSTTSGRRTEPTPKTSKSSLFCLGVLILELWFNQAIESRPFRHQFFGPDGRENEYTNFNTAQKWQEQALEEGGLDLHNATRRCIYCTFGTASQDLNNLDFQASVYDEIVEALTRLVARYEEL